jgi:hypothetical protein
MRTIATGNSPMALYFYLFRVKASILHKHREFANFDSAALSGSPDEQSGPEVLRLAEVRNI